MHTHDAIGIGSGQAGLFLEVGGRALTAPKIFINVGGRAVLPDWPGIDVVPVLTNTRPSVS